jgi:hypothetical protein
MKNIVELREFISRDLKRLKRPNEVTARANSIINTAKTQIVYAVARGERPDIAFMDVAQRRVFGRVTKTLANKRRALA